MLSIWNASKSTMTDSLRPMAIHCQTMLNVWLLMDVNVLPDWFWELVLQWLLQFRFARMKFWIFFRLPALLGVLGLCRQAGVLQKRVCTVQYCAYKKWGRQALKLTAGVLSYKRTANILVAQWHTVHHRWRTVHHKWGTMTHSASFIN